MVKMLNRIEPERLDRAIEYMKKLAAKDMSDEVCVTLAILYDYRGKITRGERKHAVISQ